MRVLRAHAMGLCFGVRDALDVAFDLPDPDGVTIHGELVHNEVVRERLEARGFDSIAESGRASRVPARDEVLITAHGVSDRERERLRRLGKSLIDTTCPLVRRAHDAARRLADAGYHVLVIGRPGHVEVEGLVGDLPSWNVVPDADSVQTYPHDRLGVVCQTTCPNDRAHAVIGAIRDANPHATLRFVDTICEPTRQRIRAVEDLALRVDALVVVGGANSNNTRALADLARARGCVAHHVQGAEDLDPTWFDGVALVGLTAGTSTLDETVDEVAARLDRIAAAQQDPPAAAG